MTCLVQYVRIIDFLLRIIMDTTVQRHVGVAMGSNVFTKYCSWLDYPDGWSEGASYSCSCSDDSEVDIALCLLHIDYACAPESVSLAIS